MSHLVYTGDVAGLLGVEAGNAGLVAFAGEVEVDWERDEGVGVLRRLCMRNLRMVLRCCVLDLQIGPDEDISKCSSNKKPC